MNKLSAQYWSKRYQNNETGWDLGKISPPLKNYFDQLDDKELKILIPGCGRGYEGLYLWEIGFRNIYFLDFSEQAILSIKDKNDQIPDNQLLYEDFFKLENEFDLIIEQTMFCAIDPSLRKDYVHKAWELLKSGGKITGLLFNRNFDGGPPFGGNKEEYLTLFSSKFDVKYMQNCYNSIPPRMGSEVFFQCLKK